MCTIFPSHPHAVVSGIVQDEESAASKVRHSPWALQPTRDDGNEHDAPPSQSAVVLQSGTNWSKDASAPMAGSTCS